MNENVTLLSFSKQSFIFFGFAFSDKINSPSEAAIALKDNKKIILWVIVNLEVWDPDLAQPRNILPPPMNVPMLPDLRDWAWHEKPGTDKTIRQRVPIVSTWRLGWIPESAVVMGLSTSRPVYVYSSGCVRLASDSRRRDDCFVYR